MVLDKLTVVETINIADLAEAARNARDRALTGLPEEEVGAPSPARGAHNAAEALGFDPLPWEHPARTALRNAVGELSSEARSELLALTWIGHGEYAAKDWQEAVAAAAAATHEIDLLPDRADLHEHLMKALYELRLMA